MNDDAFYPSSRSRKPCRPSAWRRWQGKISNCNWKKYELWIENEILILLLSCRIEMRSLRSDFVISGVRWNMMNIHLEPDKELAWRKERHNTHLIKPMAWSFFFLMSPKRTFNNSFGWWGQYTALFKGLVFLILLFKIYLCLKEPSEPKLIFLC